MTDSNIYNKKSEKIAIKVSIVGIIINVGLSLFKMIVGILGNSYAMISDSVHSLSDVLSTVVVIVGVKISTKDADSSHRFGHERFECVSAIILAFILFMTGFEIGRIALSNVINGLYKERSAPSLIALIGSLLSILIKEAMFWYTIVVAKKINSSALKADAWHHRSDALSSVGSLVGVWGAMLGLMIFDSLAGILIGCLIVKVGIDIFIDSVKKMTDESADVKTEKQIVNYIQSKFECCDIDDLKTRVFANKIYVELEIALNERLNVNDAHQIVQEIHDDIEKTFPFVKHIMIHVNPK